MIALFASEMREKFQNTKAVIRKKLITDKGFN